MEQLLVGTPYTIEQIKRAGFSDEEINQHIENHRIPLRNAGFSDVEINQYYGAGKPQPIDLSDMPFFEAQPWINQYLNTKPIESWSELEDAFTETLVPVAKHIKAIGYGAAETFNLTLGRLAVGLGERFRYLREKDRRIRAWQGDKSAQGQEESPQEMDKWTYDLLEKAKVQADENADYWAKRTQDVGMNYFDEFLSHFIGGMPIGVLEWDLNIPWAALGGAEEAQKAGENEWIGAFKAAAERKALGMFFHLIGRYKKWMQSPLMGTALGTQAALHGGASKEIAEAVGTGMLLPFTNPSTPANKMGLDKYQRALRKESDKLLEKTIYEEKDAISRDLQTTREPITGEHLDLFPEDYPEISKTAMMYRGNVFTSPLNPKAPHVAIAIENNLLATEAIPGFLDKNGQFLYQYPMEAAKTLRQWDEDGIRVGEPAVHFRSTGKRVENILSPEKHMGLIHGSEKKLAENYGLEKDGGLFIPRIYAYKSPMDKEGVIPVGGFYIFRIDGPILRASSPEAQKLYEKARDEIGKNPKYSPEDAGAIQLTFERMVRDNGYAALDTESQQGYKIFTDQKVANISPDLIDRLYTNLVSNGGITHDLMNNADMYGQPYYAVSPYKPREQKFSLDKFSKNDVRKFIIDNRDLLTLPDHNFGGGKNKEGDKWVLDVAKTVPDRMEAIRLMEQNDQDSIYDLKNGVEIFREQGHREYLQYREAQMGGRVGLPGIPEGEPEMKPRKFLKTIGESMSTEQQLKERIEEIKPQDYEVLHDKEQFAKAEFRISTPEALTQAIEDLRNGKIPMDEEGYVIISLIKKLQMEGDYARAADIVDLGTYVYTSIGRMMRTASLWSQLTPATFLRWAQKQLDKVNANRNWLDINLKSKKVTLSQMDQVYLMREKDRIDRMPNGIEKINANLNLIDFVAKKVPPGFSELIDAFRYQNMLCGIQSSERNTGTNTMQAFFTRPWDIATRGATDYIQSLLTGKDREYYISNVTDYYKAGFNNLPNAMRGFIQAMKMQGGIGKPEMGIEAQTEFERARARQMPVYLTAVQRFMEGQDRFFSTVIAAGEKAANLKNGMPEMEAQARGEAMGQKYLFRDKMKIDLKEYSLFSNILEGVGTSMEFIRKVPVLGKISGWTVPFLRTPLNVGIQMIEHSPLTALRKLSSWDQEIAARFVNGSIVTGIGAVFANFGETTWLPPTGEEERKWWYATGRKPFSAKIGEKWVPMWYLGPYALAFGLPTMVKYYFVDSRNALTEEVYEKLGHLATGLTRFLASQTSTKSVGDLFDLLSGGTSVDLPKYFENTFGQLIPAQGFLRWMAKVIDPVYRQSEDAVDALIKNIPFWSKTLPAYEKPFKEESQREWWNQALPWDLGQEDLTYKDLWPMVEMEGRLEHLERHGTEAFKKIFERPEDAEKYIKKFEEINKKYIDVTEKGLGK